MCNITTQTFFTYNTIWFDHLNIVDLNPLNKELIRVSFLETFEYNWEFGPYNYFTMLCYIYFETSTKLVTQPEKLMIKFVAQHNDRFPTYSHPRKSVPTSSSISCRRISTAGIISAKHVLNISKKRVA